MEIKRNIGSSNIPIPIDTEPREVPQQLPIQRGIGNTSDSFERASQQDPQSMINTTIRQPSDSVSTGLEAKANNLQQAFEQNFFLSTGIFQVPKKPKLEIGKDSLVLIKLSQVTGKSPAELEALFKKYGLDPGNLPDPPNDQVAALFNDPAFDSSLNNLKANVSSSYQNLQNQINYAKSEANSINNSNLASDTSVVDNLDTSSFKFLNEAYYHYDPYSQALKSGLDQLCERTSDLLGAMYPGKSSNDAYGGVKFGDKWLNICPNSASGQIKFQQVGNPEVDWPDVQRVPWYYDSEGDAAVNPPSWMVNQGYPRIAYDN
jgi:hypothetical protein